MTMACNRIASPLRLTALAIVPGSLCVGTPAHADTRMGANVSAGATVESNPYLANGSGTDIAGSLQIDPWLRISDAITSVDLRANLSADQYLKSSNGTNVSGTVSAGVNHRLSPFVSVTAGVDYLTSRNGINQGFAIVGPDDPLPPPTTPLPDTSLAGTRTRTHSLTGTVGISARPSPFDQVGASFTASRSSYGSSAGRDFSFLNAGLNYSRTLSEHTSMTASVRYGKSNYAGTNVSDGTIITPEVGVNLTLSERTTLSASLGASFSRSKLLDGSTLKSTSLSGQMRLCRSQERGSMCLNVARSAQPTGVGSISTVTSVGFGFDRRLSKRDTMSLSLGFDKNDYSRALIGGPESSKYYSASGTWSHTMGRRVSVYVTPSYARTANSSRSYGSYRLSVGLMISFGAI